jgi:hypothetical protein
MRIIGVDYHPSVQQIAWMDKETGECGEQRLAHCAYATVHNGAKKAVVVLGTSKEGETGGA